MPNPVKPDVPLIEVGRFPRIAQARLRGLVISAASWPYWIERDGRDWVLLVEPSAHEAVLRELAAFEAEEKDRPQTSHPIPAEKTSTFSLYVFAWILCAFFLAQKLAPATWVDRGVAVNGAILHGQWQRTVTALTLHADLAHLAANVATGVLFAGFLLPRLGAGVTWLAIVASGALGNAINAWGYRGESHDSIGASTACFGALGLLVGVELTSKLRDRHGRSLWQLVLPLGAGLGLLAYLGVGDEGKSIDYMAHCWGFLAGGCLGMLAAAFRLREGMPPWAQRAAAMAALGVVAVAWVMAVAGS